jgi:soluble lytic murein transglycosylase
MTLGSAHLADLVDSFGGSYVLAIVSYNAGSHRAREWIADFGDPRSRSVDVVDWIELIPFAETRNYVQRVTENLQVYRHRLAGQPTPITLEQDLKRGG